MLPTFRPIQGSYSLLVPSQKMPRPKKCATPSGLARKTVQKLRQLPTPSAAGKRQLDQQPPDRHLLRFEGRRTSPGHNSVSGSTDNICCCCGYGWGSRGNSLCGSSRCRRGGARSAAWAAISPGVQNELRWSVVGALLDESDVLVLDLFPQLFAAAATSIEENRLGHGYGSVGRTALIVSCGRSSAMKGGDWLRDLSC